MGWVGEWAFYPHQDTPEAELFNNCYALYCTRIVAKVAAALGDAAGAAKYTALATSHAANIHAKFYVASSHGCVTIACIGA